MSHKGIFEDSDEFSDEESGEDFSASEEEWAPGKDDKPSDDDDDIDAGQDFTDDDDDDDDDDEPKSKRGKKSKATKNIAKTPKVNKLTGRRQTQSLRSKLFRRYNPPPKTGPKSPVPAKVVDILSSSQYTKRKQMPSASTSTSTSGSAQASAMQSDSESSEDEGLVNPNEIDFNSEFFDVKTNKTQNQQQDVMPTFDCNAGMNLSDSSDEDNEDFAEVATETDATVSAKKPSIVDRINKKSSSEMHDFSSLQTFAKNLESAKAHLAKLNEKDGSTSKANTDESDITKLLSLGEGVGKVSTPSSRKRKHKDDRQHSDDSDWENVSDDGGGHAHEIKDIQITVGNEVARDMSREQKRAIDLEACLKRRMNRDIKEKQVFLHKTAVLCWIAHGNYINRVLNNMKLMEMCLKRLPSKNAYPKGDTDIKYFNMVTEWFSTTFDLKSTKQFCELKRLPPRAFSLALQIQSKKVISKCDYVLLFVTMLRSLGLQCRLVINFAVPPLRPPQKDLFVVSSKPKDAADAKPSESKNESKTKSSEPKSLAKKIKLSAEKMKASLKEGKKHSKGKDSKNVTESEPSTSSKSKSSAQAAKTEHSYAEMPSVKKVKINMSRMSQSFIERNTAESTLQGGHKKSSSITKDSPHSSPSKSKKTESNHSSNKSNQNTPMSPKINGEIRKSNENGNAAPSSSNSTKHSQSVKPNQLLVGTPTKRRLVKRTNSTDVSSNTAANLKDKQTKKNIVTAATTTTHSPRKTRSKTVRNGEATSNAKTKLKLPQLDGADDILKKTKTTVKAKAKSRPKHDDSSNSDSDFAPSPPKRVRTKITPQKPVNKALARAKQIDRRVFSTDEEIEEDSSGTRMNFWIEAYAEKEKKWIVIDPVKKKVDCVDHVRKNASKPIIYVLAWNNDNTIRDVTPRYCSQFHTATRKLRAEQLWIDEALDKLLEERNPRTIIEDVEFSKMHMDTPMPKSIGEFKNHPLYALERHLLKFEAIYPPNSLTMGYIRDEPIFARECVHTLHSREIWVKQARTVKIGEKPYKIVKARPKWNRVLNQMEEAKPLEIFGFWQTEPYKPPVAENGIVPRNPYGNVELFKPEMLPIGTRHLQLPNLNRVCKKMGVDCAQAVIGFDFHGGSSHPTFDGFVVCEEFADDVIKQWEIEQEEQIRKETEKRESRVYGNWKKLIKGLLIRERLRRKFNFGVDENADKAHGKKRKKE